MIEEFSFPLFYSLFFLSFSEAIIKIITPTIITMNITIPTMHAASLPLSYFAFLIFCKQS